MKLTYIIITIIVCCCGCSTIQTHIDEGEKLQPYRGTSIAVSKAKRAWNNYDYWSVFETYAADVPASMIADTIIFPYDLYMYLSEEQNQKELQ